MVNNYKFLREFLALRGLEMGHLNRTRPEKLFLLILVIGLFSLAGDMNVLAQDHKQIVNKDPSNIAIKGYDPVAYFTENRPVKGKPEFEYPWQGARWLFSSASNRDLFAGVMLLNMGDFAQGPWLPAGWPALIRRPGRLSEVSSIWGTASQ
jgi:hypothetical protein